MYDSPNAKDLIASVERVLQGAVLPHVADPLARQKAEMCLAVLHWAGRVVPIEQQLLASETNEMQALFARLAALFANADSPEACRLRERGQRAQGRGPWPALPAYRDLLDVHRSLSEGLIPMLDDLHALDACDCPAAKDGLSQLRAYLSRRSRLDLEVYLGAAPTGAMVGRG